MRSANLNVMTRAAEKAGRALVRDFGEVEQLQVSRKGPGDFVSTADKKAEKIVREELQKTRPDYSLLMEESGEIVGADPTRHFIVDPLDGTTNFLHGMPHWAVSIGLEENGEITAGVIYDPIKDELFWAERGKGAFINDRRIRVSGRRKLDESVIATGIPHIGRTSEQGSLEFLKRLQKMMAETAGVRRWGAASLDLCYVAAGRFDGFWESGLCPWDVAAGLIILKEAGGFITNAKGQPYSFESSDIVAANEGIHSDFLKLIRQADK